METELKTTYTNWKKYRSFFTQAKQSYALFKYIRVLWVNQV